MSRAKEKKMYLQDIPHDVTAERLRELMDSHPYLMEQLQSVDQELYNCLEKKNISDLRLLLMSRVFKQYKQTYEKKRVYDEMLHNPDDEEVQKKIEEAIRLENVNESLNLAQESLPESFGRVEMLYVKIEINNHAIKAFVDSGAQSTLMSAKCAEKCNLMRLLDTRFHGEARGVGTGKILGRVHMAQMKCGGSYYPISITVLETSDIEFLFGLDNLRRYSCVLDLGKNVLRINNGDDTCEELVFLSEFEVKSENNTLLSSSSSSSSSAASTLVSPQQSSTATRPTPKPVEKSDVMSSVAPVPTSLPHNSSSDSSVESQSQEAKIAELTSLGFTAHQAAAALIQSQGDVNLAATFLMEDM